MTNPVRLPRILLTNDDGLEAPGLMLLEELVAVIADDIWVVAPDLDQSGKAQCLTLNNPLRAQERRPRHFAVNGTPSDCVAFALGHVMKNNPPAMILSGINAGANLGDEVNLSGTVGAALTGLMLGVPAIALSQQCADRHNINWDVAKAHVPTLLRHFLTHGWRKDTALSINLPEADPNNIKEFVWARAAQKTLPGIAVEERTDQRGFKYYWLSFERDYHAHKNDDSDAAVLRRDQIAVTSLSLDRSLSLARAPVPLSYDPLNKAA